MKDRIQRIISRENLTASKFADIIGVQRSSVSHIISGRNNPGLDFLSKILQNFPHISGDWLITGQGSMVKLSGNSKMPSLFDKKENDEAKRPAVDSTQNEASHVDRVEAPPQVNIPQETAPITQEKVMEQPPINIPLPLITAKSNVSIEKIVVLYVDKTFLEYSPR